jgi:hypothetical protein
MKNTEKLFKDLVNGDEASALESFKGAIQDKFDQAMAVRKVAVSSEVFNQAVVEESSDLSEAKLEEPESKKDLVDLLKKAKQVRGVTDDEYMSWYGNMDDKLFSEWDKMVKKDMNYKKAYKLGYDGGSDKNPHKSGTLAAAIWADQYAAGAMDA